MNSDLTGLIILFQFPQGIRSFHDFPDPRSSSGKPLQHENRGQIPVYANISRKRDLTPTLRVLVGGATLGKARWSLGGETRLLELKGKSQPLTVHVLDQSTAPSLT
jgi:hypothetical protein